MYFGIFGFISNASYFFGGFFSLATSETGEDHLFFIYLFIQVSLAFLFSKIYLKDIHD